MQPGSKTMGPPMENAMVCHITEGGLQIEQEGKTFAAKKKFVWTCNKETKEFASNMGKRGRNHADHGPKGLRLVSS
jgi:hypothetical protein